MFVLLCRLPDQAEVPAVQPRPQQLLRLRPAVWRVEAAVGGAGGGQHAGEGAALCGLLLQLDQEPGTNTIYIIYTDTSPAPAPEPRPLVRPELPRHPSRPGVEAWLLAEL